MLRDSISEYLRLTELCLTMILGSVEDERVFSVFGFIKSNIRNKLDKNLDTCLRMYNYRYDVLTTGQSKYGGRNVKEEG